MALYTANELRLVRADLLNTNEATVDRNSMESFIKALRNSEKIMPYQAEYAQFAAVQLILNARKRIERDHLELIRLESRLISQYRDYWVPEPCRGMVTRFSCGLPYAVAPPGGYVKPGSPTPVRVEFYNTRTWNVTRGSGVQQVATGAYFLRASPDWTKYYLTLAYSSDVRMPRVELTANALTVPSIIPTWAVDLDGTYISAVNTLVKLNKDIQASFDAIAEVIDNTANSTRRLRQLAQWEQESEAPDPGTPDPGVSEPEPPVNKPYNQRDIEF